MKYKRILPKVSFEKMFIQTKSGVVYPYGDLHLQGNPDPWIQANRAHLLRVKELSLSLSHEEGTEPKIGDSIGELSEVTGLTITLGKSIKSVPTSITRLTKLKSLAILSMYDEIEELPANLGDLKRLKYMEIRNCSLTSLPKGLNLERLFLPICLPWLPNPKHPVSVRHLSLTESCFRHPFDDIPLNLKHFINLEILSFGCSYRLKSISSFAGLPTLKKLDIYGPSVESLANLDEFPELMLMDIRHTNVKCLPWSIAKLPKLRFLFLPQYFRLETLPSNLNDSVLICVSESKGIGNTWKELKAEMEPFLSPLIGVEMGREAADVPSCISPCGYLRLKEHLQPWIQENYDYRLLVRFLELESWYKDGEELTDFIGELSELTHLYINGNECLKNNPNTITKLKHVSLMGCDIDALTDSLRKLSNLESLHIDFEYKEFPATIEMLVSLRRLSLRDKYGQFNSLPDSLANLPNLKTLELDGFYLDSSPENLNLTKLKLINTTLPSLPTSLHHLEIIHYHDRCYGRGCELNLYQLVNLETLCVSCRCIKFLPSVTGLQNLQILQLRYCFSLTALPPNLDALVNMCTLNIIGTRIKSLPYSITKLNNLRHLFLPKCFNQEDLLSYLRKRSVSVSVDDTDEIYYEEMDYSKYKTSDEGNTQSAGTIGQLNEVVLRQSKQGIITDHPSPRLPDAAARAPVLEEYSGSDSAQNEENKKEITRDAITSFFSRNMTLAAAANELDVPRSTLKRKLKEFQIKWPSSRDSKKKHITESPSNKNPSPENMKITTEPAGREQFMEGFDVANQQTLSVHVPSQCNNINNSAVNAGMRTVDFPTVAIQVRTDGRELAREFLNGAKKCTLTNTIQESLSSCCIVVKATYEGSTVRFDLSSGSVDELKKEIADNLELEMELGKFKITYQDEDQEWMLMTKNKHLEYALKLLKSSGSNVLRLKVIHS